MHAAHLLFLAFSLVLASACKPRTPNSAGLQSAATQAKDLKLQVCQNYFEANFSRERKGACDITAQFYSAKILRKPTAVLMDVGTKGHAFVQVDLSKLQHQDTLNFLGDQATCQKIAQCLLKTGHAFISENTFNYAVKVGIQLTQWKYDPGVFTFEKSGNYCYPNIKTRLKKNCGAVTMVPLQESSPLFPSLSAEDRLFKSTPLAYDAATFKVVTDLIRAGVRRGSVNKEALLDSGLTEFRTLYPNLIDTTVFEHAVEIAAMVATDKAMSFSEGTLPEVVREPLVAIRFDEKSGTFYQLK